MRRLNYVLVSFLLSVSIFYTSVHAADKIRIGVPPVGIFLPLTLTQKKGFFKEEGFDAEMITTRGAVAIAALSNGEMDYFASIGFSVRAAVGGLPVKVVACYLPGAPLTLIARPEIKSVQELKGKTIGVGVFGGTPDLIARMILKHFGIDPEKEVKFVMAGLTIDARLAAMKQGVIAATPIPVPGDLQGKKMGFRALANAYELFNYPDVGLVATAKKIKERPDEIKRVIKAGIKANRYIRENRDGTIQVLMEWLKIDKDIARASYEFLSKAINEDGSIPEDGLRLVIEEAKKVSKVDRDIPISEVADLSILREAQKEFGIKGR